MSTATAQRTDLGDYYGGVIGEREKDVLAPGETQVSPERAVRDWWVWVCPTAPEVRSPTRPRPVRG